MTTTRTALCAGRPDLFQDPLLEEPPTRGTAEARRRYATMTREAAELCAACPLWSSCLYDAVVRHDVAGFAAGTTLRERDQIRRVLGITVEPEDFDTLAGVTAGHRHIDHDEVVRLRAANPHESLERLARRLGCSLSTVKRHLRQERRGATVRAVDTTAEPTLAAVVAAAGTIRRAARAAA